MPRKEDCVADDAARYAYMPLAFVGRFPGSPLAGFGGRVATMDAPGVVIAFTVATGNIFVPQICEISVARRDATSVALLMCMAFDRS